MQHHATWQSGHLGFSVSSGLTFRRLGFDGAAGGGVLVQAPKTCNPFCQT